MGKYTLRHQLFRLPALIILPITYGLIKLFSSNSSLTDSLYCSWFYPRVSRLLLGLTRGLPFSVIEFAAYIIIAGFIITLVIRVIKLILIRKDALMKLVSILITIAVTASYAVFLFYLLWGFNFYRTPIDKRMDLPQREYTADELFALSVKLADDAKAIRDKLENDTGGALETGDINELFKSVEATYNAYGSTHDLFENAAPIAKEFMFSGLLSRLRILGFYSGYTSEPNVNTQQPSLYLGYTAAHETAHFYGWAREDEANFVAYMICYRSENKTVAYSVTMHALTNCAARLAELDDPRLKELYSHYSDSMKRDIYAYNEYYSRFETSQAGDIAEHINDSYLSFNGQQGVKSYENDVDLLLRYYDALGLFTAI